MVVAEALALGSRQALSDSVGSSAGLWEANRRAVVVWVVVLGLGSRQARSE